MVIKNRCVLVLDESTFSIGGVKISTSFSDLYILPLTFIHNSVQLLAIDHSTLTFSIVASLR